VRKLVLVLAIAGLMVALGATPVGAGEGNVKKFCKTNLALSTAFNAEEPDLERVNRLLDRAANTAPPEIAEAVDVAVPAFKEDPETAFEDPVVTQAVTEIDEFAYESCGYEQVDVTLEDYAFVDVPDELETGTVAFRLTNEGAEFHELIVFRIKGDESIEELLELPEEEVMEKVTEVGAGFAAPGETSYALMKLKKEGRYAGVCFIPVGATDEASAEAADEAGAPPHFTEGMVVEFEVTE
jgi:hypothetical protein